VKTGVLTRIAKFNEGRDPERLALKFAALRHDAFTLLRGTCHLFYEDLRASDLPMSPLVWCCGDLHLENFGTYKGDNRLAYFDLNDFDEACLTPALWELVRFLTSVRVGGKTLGMDRRMTTMLMRTFLAPCPSTKPRSRRYASFSPSSAGASRTPNSFSSWTPPGASPASVASASKGTFSSSKAVDRRMAISSSTSRSSRGPASLRPTPCPNPIGRRKASASR